MNAQWVNGLLHALTVRECTLSQLRTILADEASVALERLTIHLATFDTRSEEDCARALLRVVAETRPPRLQRLELGLLHEPLAHAGAGRDWQCLARHVPLQGTLQQAYRLAGVKRFTMLRSGTGWPAAGVTSVLVDRQIVQGEPGERGDHPHQNFSFLNENPRSAASVGIRRKRPFELRVNGLAGPENRRLIHGDLVEGRDFAFRFEED